MLLVGTELLVVTLGATGTADEGITPTCAIKGLVKGLV
jgi:hypothetical protein